jgi:hypothetical protein
MSDYKMTKKEAFGYWFKIIFLAVFGLIAAGAAIYTFFWYPFSILTLIYGVFMGGGAVFCGWAVKTLTKEYFFWKNKEKEENKHE